MRQLESLPVGFWNNGSDYYMSKSLRLEYPTEFQGVRNYLFGRQRSYFLNLAQDLCGVL